MIQSLPLYTCFIRINKTIIPAIITYNYDMNAVNFAVNRKNRAKQSGKS